MKKQLLLVCRILVGALFIFSGLIKANDPLGFSYKLVEYFEVFHITFLNGIATGLAIFLCALEMILGAALLLGIRPVAVAKGLLATIIFFTFLTFYSAAFDVVKTCGCFGDAIPLTPWQSFSKDLVLLLLIIYIFINSRLIRPVFASPVIQQRALWTITIISFGVGLYTYNFLPVIDFLPYKVGANLPAEMKIPPGAPVDVFETIFQLRNKKTRAEKTMTSKEYMDSGIWKDSDWEIFGEPVNKLVKKGFEPRIKDLKISDSQGTDYTAELIENPYYSLIIVADNLGNADKKALGDLNALCINAYERYNTRSVLLTSTAPSGTEAFRKENKLVMEAFYADAVPLKSMVRANPGLLLLKNGTVINKWHYHSLPSFDQLEKQYLSKN